MRYWSLLVIIALSASVGFALIVASVTKICFDLQATCHWVAHTYDVSEVVHNAQTHLHQADADERGFLLTGDTAYLNNYHAAKTLFGQDVQRLRALTADNENQQRRLASLSPLISTKLNGMEANLASERQRKHAATLQGRQINLAQRSSLQVSHLLTTMADEEDQLVRERISGSEHMIELSRSIIVGSVSAVVGLLILSATLIMRNVKQKRADEQKLSDYAIILEFQKAELERANSILEQMAITDGLTGLRNARSFHIRLTEEFERSLRQQSSLSLILLDVDRFKEFNDTFGHLEGDLVLANVGRILQLHARETDIAARHGGEEFSLVLPDTNLHGAERTAELIRSALADASWSKRAITASFGVSALSPQIRTPNDLIASADKALYRAKAKGRNCVCLDAI